MNPHQSTSINQLASVKPQQSTHINLLSSINPHQSTFTNRLTSIDPHQSTHNPHHSTRISQPTINPHQPTHLSQPTSINLHQSTHISHSTSVVFTCRGAVWPFLYLYFAGPCLGLDCHNTPTPARTPRLGLSQHTDTSKNTKAWTVTTH